MIFSRLAEKGFTAEQVLDFTPHITRIYLADEASLLRGDDLHREHEIREKLNFYKGKRLLTMKYQKELDEHLAKTGESRKQINERTKMMIVERISNG